MDGMLSGLWGMAVGAALLLYGLCRVQTGGSRRRQRRIRLCLLGGGSLFVLGVLFVCCPQPYAGTLLWLWGGGTALLLFAHEWLSPE